ncbi:MAG: EF-P beta-lysylation protein EpmB [Pseudohongiellaceae bacterium]|jgi:EF-P beta-lysylation protein EpmB
MNKLEIPIIQSDQPKNWQQMLSDLITDPRDLTKYLELDENLRPASLMAQSQFPMKVPMPFIAKMNKGDWDDPLLRQVWPAAEEEIVDSRYVTDPLAEADSNPIPGLLHKYHGRVLLTAAPHCAVHCRYCFRRHFDYEENAPSRALWQQCFDYINADSSIEEVILSGGDPLALADKQLSWLLDQLESIKHITTIRIHTRLPIVLPQRITEALIETFRQRRIKLVMVIHCNHPQELCPQSSLALNTLAANGLILMNQSVILRDVNDNSDCLIELSRKLFSVNVLPYYLHLPDEVAGTAHFDVSKTKALELLAQMQTRLPGYLVPKLVKEEAGEPSKTRIV